MDFPAWANSVRTGTNRFCLAISFPRSAISVQVFFFPKFEPGNGFFVRSFALIRSRSSLILERSFSANCFRRISSEEPVLS